MAIQAIHHVSLLVTDTGRALRFYRDLLGLELAERPYLGFPGAWLGIGDGELHLLELHNPDPLSGRPEHVGRDRHLALVVDDLDGLVGRLQHAGVNCARSRSGRPAVFCRDPDGNGIELVQIMPCLG